MKKVFVSIPVLFFIAIAYLSYAGVTGVTPVTGGITSGSNVELGTANIIMLNASNIDLTAANLNQPFTSLAGANVYGYLHKWNANGGLLFGGFSNADGPGVVTYGMVGSNAATLNNPAYSYIVGKYDGANGSQPLGNADVAMTFTNGIGGDNLLTLYGNGDFTVSGVSKADHIAEKTGGHGVTVDNNFTVSGTVTASNAIWGSPTSIPEVVVASNASLNAANVSGTILNNYGQNATANITMPAAAAGYSFIAAIGTAYNAPWTLQFATNTVILNGTPNITNVGANNQSVGSRLVCQTIKTGASTWTWICSALAGTWGGT
jgi:hypothetical protein